MYVGWPSCLCCRVLTRILLAYPSFFALCPASSLSPFWYFYITYARPTCVTSLRTTTYIRRVSILAHTTSVHPWMAANSTHALEGLTRDISSCQANVHCAAEEVVAPVVDVPPILAPFSPFTTTTNRYVWFPFDSEVTKGPGLVLLWRFG